MDRFTRFKMLRALWARAKNLLAWLYGPRAREERLRFHMLQQINQAQRWHAINTTERQLRDGYIRGAGDPDSVVPPPDPRPGQARPDQADAAWQAQWQAQREWMAAYEQQERARQAQHRNGRR